MSCGKLTTVAVTQQGQLYVAGDNRNRQLAIQGKHDEIKEMTPLNDLPHKITKVACGARHTLMLTDKNTLYAVGDN